MNTPAPPALDWSDVMAASIHDIKNSLALILGNLDDLVGNPENRLADPRQATLLKQEVQRVHRSLIQVLMLYKLGNQQFVPQIAEHNLEDFLEEVVADNQSHCAALGLELGFACDAELTGYFDWELVRGVLDSTIGNACRYAGARIRIRADREQGELLLRVEDDGAGFPASVLSRLPDPRLSSAGQPNAGAGNPGPANPGPANPGPANPGIVSPDPIMAGRTRLGLYFAAQVAAQHRDGERVGGIRLANGGAFGGGVFELRLP